MLSITNPWVSMWTSPRSTIRSIINLHPRFGVFTLSWIFLLHNYFFSVTYWSLGLKYSFNTLLLIGIILSALLAIPWIYFIAFLFSITGRLFKGRAPQSHLRCALAWSKLPFTISLLMWLILMAISPSTTFISATSGPSTLFLNFITFILSIYSFILLLQSLKEVQQFGTIKAFLNIILVWFITWILTFLIFFTVRYFI